MSPKVHYPRKTIKQQTKIYKDNPPRLTKTWKSESGDDKTVPNQEMTKLYQSPSDIFEFLGPGLNFDLSRVVLKLAIIQLASRMDDAITSAANDFRNHVLASDQCPSRVCARVGCMTGWCQANNFTSCPLALPIFSILDDL